MWGGIVSTLEQKNNSMTTKSMVAVCAWCPDALQRTEDAIAAGLVVSHAICERCRMAFETEEVLTIPEVRAWGARLLAKFALHKQKLAGAGCQRYADGVEWAMNEFDGALRGFLDGFNQ